MKISKILKFISKIRFSPKCFWRLYTTTQIRSP